MINEYQLREYLGAQLHLIEPGLCLHRHEVFLPSAESSSGRVDLVARDQRGMHVLIELKRARGSSREGIQQLAKYVRLYSESSLLPRSRIRCILVSDDWSELLAAFTVLESTFPCRLTGYRFSFDAAGLPFGFERVAPLSFTPSVDLSPNHFMVVTHSAEERDEALRAAESLLASVDLPDFLVFIFEYSNARSGREDYLLYFVLQTVTTASAAALKRATGTTVESDGTPTLFGDWETAAFSLIARGRGRDNVDPGSPATLMHYEKKYPLWQIRRFGRFGRIAGLWTDRDLILETIRCAYDDSESDDPPATSILEAARQIHQWDF